MTDRDRLIEVILNAPRKDVVYGDIKLDKPVQTAQSVADHILADGWIRPPCKVGQTVYIIDEPDFADDFVLDVKVSEIGQDFRGMWIGLELPLGMRLSQYVFPNNLGKTVFLTKEEAEKALEGRKNGKIY